MRVGEEQRVLSLVMRGFDEFVRPGFSDEGGAEFTRAARAWVVDQPPEHIIMVAVIEGELVGMIDVKGNSHISLFFVDAARHGRGIGRALLEHAIAECRSRDSSVRSFDVDSSLWAVPVYEKLGFSRTGPEREQNGIRFVEMARTV